MFFDKTVTSILLHKTRPFKFFACSFSVETGPLLIHPSLSQVALLCVCLYVCGVGVLLNYTVCDVCRPFFAYWNDGGGTSLFSSDLFDVVTDSETEVRLAMRRQNDTSSRTHRTISR